MGNEMIRSTCLPTAPGVALQKLFLDSARPEQRGGQKENEKEEKEKG